MIVKHGTMFLTAYQHVLFDYDEEKRRNRGALESQSRISGQKRDVESTETRGRARKKHELPVKATELFFASTA